VNHNKDLMLPTSQSDEIWRGVSGGEQLLDTLDQTTKSTDGKEH